VQGKLVSTEGVKTRAEGLAVARAYPTPFELLRGRLDGVVLVSDEEMERAVAKLFYAVRQVAELAGAASTAAAYKLGFKNLKTVVMLTGSNIQPSQLAEILSKHT
jgi:threonine dehydratase